MGANIAILKIRHFVSVLAVLLSCTLELYQLWDRCVFIKFDLFYNQIDSVCKKHVPYKRLSKKEVKISSKPWINREILAKMNYRDKLYSKLLKCKQPDPNLRYLYKKFRNKVVKDLKDSKSTYFNQYFK